MTDSSEDHGVLLVMPDFYVHLYGRKIDWQMNMTMVLVTVPCCSWLSLI